MGANHYEDMILSTPDLLSYWKMQETSGNIADAVGGLTGTAAGTPVYAQSVSLPGLGSADKSILLNNNPEGFNIQDNYDFSGTTAFSIGGWFQIATSPGYGMYLLQKGASQYAIILYYGSTIKFTRGGVEMIQHNTPAIGATSHFCMVYTGTQLIGWLNGVPGSMADANSSSNEATDLRLGCNRYGFAPLSGYMAHYYVVNRALTAQEVWSHYAGGREMASRGFGGFR